MRPSRWNFFGRETKGLLLAVTVEDVRALLAETGDATLAYLEHFKRSGAVFSSADHLIKALVGGYAAFC